MQKGVNLILLFVIITQILGLYLGIQYNDAIAAGKMSSAVENPESIGSALFLFGAILVMTIIILFAVRYWGNFMIYLENFVIFTILILFFDSILPIPVLTLYFAFGLVLLKIFNQSEIVRNLIGVICGATVGALLGASLGIIPALSFFLILVIYDFISVFITKHMIKLAETVTKNPSSLMFSSAHKFSKPVKISGKFKKVHVFRLGLGDAIIPLIFIVSALRTFGIVHALFAMAGCWISLYILFRYITKHPRPLPALPFLFPGTIAGFLLAFLV